MLLTFLLAAVNIFWAGYILGDIIVPKDPGAMWFDVLRFIFSYSWVFIL